MCEASSYTQRKTKRVERKEGFLVDDVGGGGGGGWSQIYGDKRSNCEYLELPQ
jgi:hypothetical protein